MKTSADKLSYTDLNSIQDEISTLATDYGVEFTKHNYSLNEVPRTSNIKNIEDTIDNIGQQIDYGALSINYNNWITKKDWLGLKIFSHNDYNRWENNLNVVKNYELPLDTPYLYVEMLDKETREVGGQVEVLSETIRINYSIKDLTNYKYYWKKDQEGWYEDTTNLLYKDFVITENCTYYFKIEKNNEIISSATYTATMINAVMRFIGCYTGDWMGNKYDPVRNIHTFNITKTQMDNVLTSDIEEFKSKWSNDTNLIDAIIEFYNQTFFEKYSQYYITVSEAESNRIKFMQLWCFNDLTLKNYDFCGFNNVYGIDMHGLRVKQGVKIELNATNGQITSNSYTLDDGYTQTSTIITRENEPFNKGAYLTKNAYDNVVFGRATFTPDINFRIKKLEYNGITYKENIKVQFSYINTTKYTYYVKVNNALWTIVNVNNNKCGTNVQFTKNGVLYVKVVDNDTNAVVSSATFTVNGITPTQFEYVVNGLNLMWEGKEVENGELIDLSGNNLNGTIGQYCNIQNDCINISKTDGTIAGVDYSIHNYDLYNTSLKNMPNWTLEQHILINASGSSSTGILSLQTSSEIKYMNFVSNGIINFAGYAGDGYHTNRSYAGQHITITVTRTGNTYEYFINGVYMGTSTYGGTGDFSNLARIIVGPERANGNGYSTNIDFNFYNLRLYNRVLTNQEIETNYLKDSINYE